MSDNGNAGRHQSARVKARWRVRFAVIGFVILLVFPLFDFFAITSFADRISPNQGRIYSTAGILIFLGISLALMIPIIKFPFRRPPNPLFFIIGMLAVAFLGSTTSLQPLFTAAYSTLLIAVVVSMAHLPGTIQLSSRTHLSLAAWLTAAVIVSLFLYHDVYFPRRVGGIQPNELAKAAIVAMALAFLAGSRFRLLFFVFALSVTLFASSRGGISILLIFSIIYLFLRNPFIVAAMMSTLFVATGALLWILIILSVPELERLIREDILAIESATRGIIGTGFTGRSDYWFLAMDTFGNGSLWRFFFGYGFATRESTQVSDLRFLNAHQGYLNALLDIGFLGTSLFILAATSATIQYLKRGRNLENGQYSAAAAAFCIAYLISMFLDPIYFRLGMPFSTLFVYLVVTSGIKA